MPIKSILISGAGIAGPTLAYWLDRHGFVPTLLERAPRLRAGGYVIDFWGLGYDIAERMGLLADLRSAGYDIRELRLVNARGRRVGGFDVDVFRALAGGRYVSIPRSDLARLIYQRLPAHCETIFGDSIADIAPGGDGVRVRFEHAPARRFDLVVGADGLYSNVRRLAFGGQERFERYLGYAVAAFEVAGYRPRDENVYVSYSVPGKQAARLALRDDRTLFLLLFAAAQPIRVDPGDLPAQKAILRAQFGDAGWECPQILAALDGCDTLYFDRVSQIRMDTWTRGRVILLGDAAWCPSLLAGQGSALAMIGAYVLAGELGRDEGRTLDGLQRYERMLRPFMTGKQDAAVKLAGSFVPNTRLGLAVRNQVTRALAIPLLARLFLGRSLLDRLDLPDYPVVRQRAPRDREQCAG